MRHKIQASIVGILSVLLMAGPALGVTIPSAVPDVLTLATASMEPTELEKNLDGNVQMKVQFDYHDRIQIGDPVPAFVTIDNRGEAMEGEVHVRLFNQQTAEAVDYVQAVSVPAKGSVQVEVPVYFSETVASVPVYLFRDGQAVAKTIKKPRYSDAKLIGILSNRPQDVAYLKKATAMTMASQAYGYNITLSCLDLDEKTFPDQNYNMNRFDAIIMHHYALNELDEAQQNALKAWLDKGGTLIVDADPTAPTADTLQAFAGIDRIQDGGNHAVGDIIQALASGSSATSSATSKMGTWKPEGEVLAKIGEQPIISKYSSGDGSIIVTAFDLGASFLDQADLSKTILTRYFFSDWTNMQNGVMFQPYMDWSGLVSAAERITWNEVPPLFMVFIICAVFILCVGPLSYFVMKKLDKRDWIWGLGPVLAMLCAGIFVGIGYQRRGTKPVSSTVHILENYGTEQWSGMSYLGVGVPKSGEYEIAVQEPAFALYGLNENVNGMYGYASAMPANALNNQMADEAKNIRLIRQNPKPSETFSHIPQWSMQGFRMLRDIKMDGGLICRLYVGREGKIFYEVTNQTGYDLEDVLVVSLIKHHRIDFLANGETKTGEVDQENTDYPSGGYFEIWPLIDKLYGEQFDASGKIAEKPDAAKESDAKKQMMLRTMANQMNIDDTEQAMVFAWSQEVGRITALANGEEAKSENNLALLMNRMKMEFGGDGELVIPEGYLQGKIVETTTSNMMPGMETRYISIPSGSVTVEFTIPNGERYDIEEIAFSAMQVTGKFEYALYNVQNGQWEDYQFGKKIDADHITQYMSKSGTIQIRFVLPDSELDESGMNVNQTSMTQMTQAVAIEENSIQGLSLQVRGKEKANVGN